MAPHAGRAGDEPERPKRRVCGCAERAREPWPRCRPTRAGSSSSARRTMAVPPLRALVDAGFDVALVVTRADKRRGPGQRRRAEPGEGGGPRARPAGHRPGRRRARRRAPTSAWSWPSGSIIKPHVLDALPMVNLHFSLLPRWRGAAPVERAHPGRRRRDRRVPHGGRGGARHRRRCSPRPRCRSGRRDGRRAAGRAGRRRHRRCSSRSSADGLGDADAAGGRGRPTPPRSTPDELALDWAPSGGRAATGSCGSAGRGPTFRGQRLKVLARRAVADAARRRRRARPARRRRGSATGDGALELRRRCSPRARAPRCRSTAWRNGARPRAGRAARRLIGARPVAPAASPSTRSSRIERDGAYANLVLPALLGRSGLDDRDRAFVTELVYGTTRMRRACDFARRPLRRPRPRRPSSRTLLRLGAYQLALRRRRRRTPR